jgi:hypothetical protein
MMKKETYERLLMDVTEFDAEDIITTSEEQDPQLVTGDNESAIGIGVTPVGNLPTGF